MTTEKIEEKKPAKRRKKKTAAKAVVAPQAVVEVTTTEHVADAITPEAKEQISEAVHEAEVAMEKVTAELTKEVLTEMTDEYETLKKELDETKNALAESKKKAEEFYAQYKSLSKSKQKYVLTAVGFVVGVLVGLSF